MYNDIHEARTLAYGLGCGWGVEDVGPYRFAGIPLASDKVAMNTQGKGSLRRELPTKSGEGERVFCERCALSHRRPLAATSLSEGGYKVADR